MASCELLFRRPKMIGKVLKSRPPCALSPFNQTANISVKIKLTEYACARNKLINIRVRQEAKGQKKRSTLMTKIMNSFTSRLQHFQFHFN